MEQTKTVAQLRAGYNKIIDQNKDKSGKPVHYYDRLQKKRAADPAAFDKKIIDAELQGKEDSDIFLNRVRDPKHPAHAAASAEYQDKYGADPVKVRHIMTTAAMKTSGVQPLEFRNKAYEDSVLNHVVIEKPQEAAVVNDLRDLLRRKGFAVGYDGDEAAAVAAQFQKENPDMRGTIAKNIRL